MRDTIATRRVKGRLENVPWATGAENTERINLSGRLGVKATWRHFYIYIKAAFQQSSSGGHDHPKEAAPVHKSLCHFLLELPSEPVYETHRKKLVSLVKRPKTK